MSRLRYEPLARLPSNWRDRARARLHRLTTPVRRRYYETGWGQRAAERLPSRWRNRLGLDDQAAIGSRRIEIGSGSRPQPGYLHVDRDPWTWHVEVVAFAWRLPFPDDWAEEILAVHSLEHVQPPLLIPTLREWRRVLMPGGRVRVHVPNGPRLMERFCDGSVAQKWAMVGALLGMNCPAESTTPADLGLRSDHQVIFDEELLSWALQSAGFRDVVDRTADIVDIHTQAWRRSVSRFSLIFEARKDSA